MGKRYRGRMCVYCGKETATTEDHVLSREFFLKADRANLPKAPACDRCNNKKSGFETYLTAVLPLAGRHPQAVSSAEQAPRRLAKHPKLARTLLASQRPAWIRDETGLYRPTAVFDFDRRQLEGLLDFVGRGLAWHHWKLCLGPDDVSGSMFLTDTGNAFLQGWLSHYTAAHRVEQSLGNGTIRYGGMQATNPLQLTVWGISMYGGLVLSGSGHKFDGSVEPSTMWWAITGPPEMRDLITLFKQSR